MSDWRFVRVQYVPQSNDILERLEVILRRNMGLRPDMRIPLDVSFISIDADEISREAIVEDCEHEFACDLAMFRFLDETPIQSLYDALRARSKAA